MTEMLIRLPQVRAMTHRSTSRIYSDMRAGRFPRPVRIGVRAVAWRVSEIAEWINDRIEERDLRS